MSFLRHRTWVFKQVQRRLTFGDSLSLAPKAATTTAYDSSLSIGQFGTVRYHESKIFVELPHQMDPCRDMCSTIHMRFPGTVLCEGFGSEYRTRRRGTDVFN